MATLNEIRALLQASLLGVCLAACSLLGVSEPGGTNPALALSTPSGEIETAPLFVPQSEAVIGTVNASLLAPSSIETFPGANGFTWLPDDMGVALAGEQGVLLMPVEQPGIGIQASTPEVTQVISSTTPSLLIAAKETGVVAWVSGGKTIHTLDVTTAQGEPTIVQSASPITGLALSSFGDEVAYATFDSQVFVQNSGMSTETRNWTSPAWLTDLTYSPNGSQLAGTDLSNFKIYFLNTDNGEILRTLEWLDSATPVLYGAYLSPDWRQAAWVAQSVVQLMDANDGLPGPLLAHPNEINAIAWSPDSRLLATSAAALVNDQLEPAVMIWDASSGALLNTLVQMESVQIIAFSPDGRQLAVLDTNGSIQTWSVSR